MSQCRQTASEFIQNTFCPHVAVLCSADAQLLCEKNNLNFVQLIQPFCRLSSEVHIRDANNVTHSILNLRVSACDMAAQPPQQNVVKKRLKDTVSSAHGQSLEFVADSVRSVESYNLQINASTPWFESWRETFLQLLPPSEHEFLNHCLACIFVISSSNGDPLSTFTSLASQQVQQQQQLPNKLPRWFCQGVLHYYVLLHDVGQCDRSRAESVFQSMKAVFGVHVCYLLQINSQSLNTVGSINSGSNLQPDPWSQFLAKPSQSVDSSENENPSVTEGSIGIPVDLLEGSSEKTSSGVMANSICDHAVEESGEICDNRTTDWRETKCHGMCLTAGDLDRLRIFVHEFVVRALIPWVERQMKIFHEQLNSRKGIHRSIFSATKKWFGTKPSGPVPASQNTTVVYARDAPELQLRRLADLAFLFQMYDYAYSIYHMLKKDFNNNQAWLHFAGAMEMASLSVFLQGQQIQKQYSNNYMERAISIYLTSCKNHPYATKATLLSTETLKKHGMYNEAAMQFLKLTSEDSDLTSALFLEQAAQCFLALKSQMVRKYAFHMILAGHRFNKAGQRKHSLRCYTQAELVYKDKHWSIAEDHIHFTIGKQSSNLKQLESATASFKNLLKVESRQSPSQQAMYLREYLFVYKQLLNLEERYSTSTQLPLLPLPLIDSNKTKVLMSPAHRECDASSHKTMASGIWFDSEASSQDGWRHLEEKLVKSSKQIYRANPQLFTSCTDNKSGPVTFVGETLVVEVEVENPLHVLLLLSDISLLWTFIPSMQGSDSRQNVISNEATSSFKNSLADEIVQTSVIKEVIVPGIQSEKILLSLTPRQAGQLKIVGVAYSLSTSSASNSPTLPETDLSSASHQQKPAHTNSLHVRGKQELQPRGPRLNGSKEERTQMLYGPDRRLDVLVCEEMPCVEVVFLEFPEVVLCGEVQRIDMEFTNVGKTSLKSLKVTSNKTGFFTFGLHYNQAKYPLEQPKYPPDNPYVYQQRKTQNRPSDSTVAFSMSRIEEFLTFPDITDIPLPKGELHSGETVSLPVWIRGDDTAGIHEVDFLFFYEPVRPFTVRYRVLRHRAVVQTVESLNVHTTVARSTAPVTSNLPQEPRSCILSCELESLAQTQMQRPHVQHFHITQVSCISPDWTVVSIGAQHYMGVHLGSQETLQLVLKGVKQEDSDKLLLSEATFDQDHVDSLCSPCSDFFIRSWQQHRTLISGPSDSKVAPVGYDLTQLNSKAVLGLTLVFLWKAYVVQEDGLSKTIVGQHHRHIDGLPVCSPVSGPSKSQPRSQPNHGQDESQPDVADVTNLRSDSAITSSLFTYSLSHSSQKEHCFTRGICIVPVRLTVQNLTETEIAITVNTKQSLKTNDENLEDFHFQSFHPQCIKWVGLTQTFLTLSRGQSLHLTLKVAITKPGTYNLNTISVFVTNSSDQSQKGLRRYATPSIITLVDEL